MPQEGQQQFEICATGPTALKTLSEIHDALSFLEANGLVKGVAFDVL
jgi:hypothetical protein